MATIGGSNIVKSGLVLDLDAANARSYPGSGTTWRDVSGNDRNGTLVSGSAFSNANQGSIVFNITTSYVDMNNNANPLLSSTGNWTINCFVNEPNYSYVAAGTGTNTIITQRIAAANNGRMHCSTSGSRTLMFLGNTGSFSSNTITGSIPLNNNTTYMLTYSRTSATIYTMYVNGVLDTTFTDTGTRNILQCGNIIGNSNNDGISYNSFQPLVLNAYQNAMSGSIYMIQIYNRALSASEILQNYNAQKSRFGL